MTIDLTPGTPVSIAGKQYTVVDADGRMILEPVSVPPLPWVEHPDAWWRIKNSPDAAAYPSNQMRDLTPGCWQRVWLLDETHVAVSKADIASAFDEYEFPYDCSCPACNLLAPFLAGGAA